MKTIPVIEIGGVLTPESPLPSSAIKIVCDGQTYTVYEAGDELPSEPTTPPEQQEV